MAQQQFLLLILSVLIVGLATTIAVEMFSQEQREVDRDLTVYTLIRLASTAQEWKLRPAEYGGGDDTAGFEGVQTGLVRLGWPASRRMITTTNPDTGAEATERSDCYQVDPQTLYYAVPQSGGQLSIYALQTPVGHTFGPDDTVLVATAVLTGTGPGDVEITVVG